MSLKHLSIKRLYRLPDKGYVAGVCAGLAQGLEWNAWLLRAVCLLGLLLIPKFAAFAYILASVLLPRRQMDAERCRYTPEESDIDRLQAEFNTLSRRMRQ